MNKSSVAEALFYAYAADSIMLLHFAFILFAVLGGFLAIWWRRVPFLHLPTVGWAVLIEFTGWVCPLTPLENALRNRAGSAGYGGGFIEHYLFAIIYPEGLTRELQYFLGFFVLVVNVAVYLWLYRRVHQNQRY